MHRISGFFFYSIILALTLPIFLPQLALMFFAPFIVITYYYKDKISCLWLSLVCGLIIDLLSDNNRLGVYALNYCLTTFILYRQKYHFFEDNLTTFPIMTFLFSCFSSLLQALLLYLFGKGIIFSWDWFKLDIILFPFIDSLFAALCFTLPFFLLPKPLKRKTKIVNRFSRS